MAAATLNLNVVEKRMLRESEAASYTGIPIKYFRAECPVVPVEMRPGLTLWDKRDLDAWIDRLKSGTESHESILARL